MLEYSPSLLPLFLDGLIRFLYQLFKHKKWFDGQLMAVAVWYATDRCSVFETEPGNKHKKPVGRVPSQKWYSRDWVSFHAARPEAWLSGEGVQEFLGARVLGGIITVGTREVASSASH